MKTVVSGNYPLVSIVTVNYNGVKVTCDLLKSLRKNNYPNVEIIVVDNASKENPDSIKENFPEIIFIKTDQNLGFAGGNNEGFKVAKGKYILMLNNDTEIDPDFLFSLVRKLEEDPGVGAVSPKLIYYGTDNIIQYAGSTSMNYYTGQKYSIGYKEKDTGQYNCCNPTPYAHGAAMMFRRSILDETGMMPSLYFLYYEELDFCERIKDAGYTIWYVGDSRVYHKESMTVGKENPLKTYYMTRNRLVFVRRNVRGIKLLISLLFFASVSVPKNILKYIMQNRIDLLKAFFRGFIWNCYNHQIFENIKIKKV